MEAGSHSDVGGLALETRKKLVMTVWTCVAVVMLCSALHVKEQEGAGRIKQAALRNHAEVLLERPHGPHMTSESLQPETVPFKARQAPCQPRLKVGERQLLLSGKRTSIQVERDHACVSDAALRRD